MVLRTSLVWNGEVMEDLVLDRPAPVTIGTSGKTTFVTPDLGLPDELAIIRPGRSGYLLVLADAMRGTVCLGGQQQAVDSVVGGEPFRALPIQEGDWGVIELGDSCRLFFQFVPREDKVELLTRNQMMIGGIGFGAFAVLGAVIWGVKGIGFGEAVFRSVGLTALIFAVAALGRVVMKQDGESKASLGFSIILHTALLSLTFHIYAQQTAYAFPEPRELTAHYLVSRPEPEPILVALPKLPTLGPITATKPAAATTVTLPTVATTKGDGSARGRRGGGPNPGGAPPSTFGILGNPELQKVLGHGVDGEVKQLAGVTGGADVPEVGPPGDGKTRGNGKQGPAGDHQKSDKPITVVPLRAAVCIGSCGGRGGPVTIEPERIGPDDGPHLTANEVDREVRRHAGMFKACYQQQLNRTPDLAGSLVMRFVIAADGTVSNVKVARDNLGNDTVAACMTRNIRTQLKFPPKGGAKVTYPFVFSPGG